MSRSSWGGRRNIMVRIAVWSTALGVAVMIITLAVIAGFSREIERRMTGFTGHVRVTSASASPADEEPPMFLRESRVEAMLLSLEGVAALDAYAVRGGVVKHGDAVEGLVLKGYDGSGGGFFAETLVEGEMPRRGDSLRYKDVLLSRTAAEKLDLGTGDRMEMLFFEEGRPPRRDRFTVSGIYSTGMDESERLVALTDIRNVRRLAMCGDSAVSGYELRLADGSRCESCAAEADRRLLYDADGDAALRAESIRDIYPAVFDWQNTHDVNGAVIITLMLLVSLFNMAAALLILVLERTRAIGVLKALGMTDASLRRTFLWRALFIMAEGVVWGDIAGAGLCLLQKYGHIIKLDPEGYILSEMPVCIEWWHVAAVDAGAVAVIVLGLLLPARIVSSVHPDEAVRYE